MPPGGRAEAAAGTHASARARALWQIYTSAFYHGTEQTLEQAQKNKLNMICEKMHLFKPGMRHLDIGCGWGTLVRWSAKEFGAKSIGVTLSKQGAKWCRDNNVKEKLAKANETDELKQGQCEILVCDYREVPSTLAKQNPSKSEEELLFDVISAVEMAEHVRIANFQLLLPTSPYISLHLPISPYISLYLPISPSGGHRQLPALPHQLPRHAQG